MRGGVSGSRRSRHALSACFAHSYRRFQAFSLLTALPSLALVLLHRIQHALWSTRQTHGRAASSQAAQLSSSSAKRGLSVWYLSDCFMRDKACLHSAGWPSPPAPTMLRCSTTVASPTAVLRTRRLAQRSEQHRQHTSCRTGEEDAAEGSPGASEESEAASCRRSRGRTGRSRSSRPSRSGCTNLQGRALQGLKNCWKRGHEGRKLCGPVPRVRAHALGKGACLRSTRLTPQQA